MRSRRIFLLVGLIAFCGLLTFGCAGDYDDVLLEEPGVIQEEISYWVGDVMVTQRETVVSSYDNKTHHFRGSVKNFGTVDLTNARFNVITYDVRVELDGSITRQDEEIGISQFMGVLHAQQELPVNISYTYSSFAARDIVGKFEHD